jgi:hypothetical protein
MMIMPPNTQAGIGMAVVLALLFTYYRFKGPREIRKPNWIAETPISEG